MSHRHFRIRVPLTVGLLVLSVTTARAQGEFEITAVARPGDPVRAPATLVNASQPRLSDGGHVLFSGDGGLLLASAEGHIVLGAPGGVAPGGSRIVYVPMTMASVNARGQVAFVVSFVPPPFPQRGSPSGSALLLFSEGTITTIAQSGDPAPGGGTFTSGFATPAINGQGQIAFVASVAGRGQIVFTYDNGMMTEVARASDPVFDVARGGFASLRFNDAGQLVIVTECCFGPDDLAVPRGMFMSANGTVTPIAVPGMAAPEGGVFAYASQASLNAVGEVAFAASLTGRPGVGIFVFANGALRQIAYDGDVVPAGGDPAVEYTLSLPQLPSIDDLGRVAFQARVGTPLRRAVFLTSGGVVQRLVGAGDLTREGETLNSATAPWFNGRGDLVFADDDAPFGTVYLITPDGISRVAGNGDAVATTPNLVTARTVNPSGRPVTGGQVFVASIFPGEMGIFDVTGALRARIGDQAPGGGFITAINDVASSETGVVAFQASLSTGGSGLFVSRAGSLWEVARTGAPAPGGGTFFFTGPPAVNAAGHVVFLGRVGVGTPPGQPAIFLAPDGTIAPVVRQGDLSPDGNPLSLLTSNPSLNDLDEVAFVAFEAPPSPLRIYVSSGETLTAIVGAGDPAPGGGTFTSSFQSFELNSAGQVVIQATTSNPLGNGIFLFTPQEGIRSVARSGDPAPIGGTLSTPQEPSLNAAGQVAFSSSRIAVPFEESNGIFLLDGVLQIVIRQGDPAPGGGTFGFTLRAPKLGASGRILFTGSASPDNLSQSGVFLASRRTPQPMVRIDIRPAGEANRINPASDRSVPVAILSDEAFDATSVIVDTVRFGPTGTEATPTGVVVRDVDGDSDVDVVVRFRIRDTGIQCGQTSALLTGRTVNDTTFAASDAVQTIRCP